MSAFEKLKQSPSQLGYLTIRQTERSNNVRIYKKMNNGKENWWPFPQEPLPAEITSFEFIEIKCVNSEVIAFLQRIERLFKDCGIVLRVCILPNQRRSWSIFKDKIWPLIKNFTALLMPTAWFSVLQENIPHTALDNFANLRMLEFSDVSPSPEAIDWLHISSTDGRPKTMRCGLRRKVFDEIRARFVAASSPTIFIILFQCLHPIEPFQIDNDVTNERMGLQLLANARPNTTELHHRRLLVRCPVDRNVEQWAQFEQTVRNWQLAEQPCLFIEFNDNQLSEE
ncbi:hypothetical protein niasHT_018297 [Heterodera trifolii]|uniref:Uncharacterized protein n=1 Tax=Heterodera trifolii TaxID=157864 RepID=A0ABD2KYT2_9BILA